MAVNEEKYNSGNRQGNGLDSLMGSGGYGGRVEVGRNHERPDMPEDGVHISARNLAVSPDEAREIAAALVRVADEFDQMVADSKPKASDILKGLPVGSVFRVAVAGVEEHSSWYVFGENDMRPSVGWTGTTRYAPEWFDNYGWEIVVKHREE